ncbi:MAG: hypothetical protein ACRC62_39260 [Microcoleus sp.]
MSWIMQLFVIVFDRPLYFRATGDREIFEKFDGAIGLSSFFYLQ